MENTPKKFILNVPTAIIIAGALIALALIITSSGKAPQVADTGGQVRDQDQAEEIAIKPVTASDHIRGSIDAPVKIVEFSDLECPFCARFHPTLQQIVEEYNGQVAWIYRHFPLDTLHAKARKEAEATECAAELGGNDGFWAYLDRLFEVTPSNDRLDLTLLPQIAEDVGLDRAQFESCLARGTYAGHIEDDYQDAVASGGTGTPYTVVIAPNGKKFPVSGAQSFESIKAIIDLALQEK